MATQTQPKQRDGVSLQTLIVAAVASAVAAIVTSTFWKNGTVLTAAITPVIVAVTKEVLARPLESDLVQRPVSRIKTARTAPQEAQREQAAREGERRRPARSFEDEVIRPGSLDDRAGAPGAGSSPVRTYGRSRGRRHLKVAVMTGIAAFAIAAVVLTVPELIFGGSVAGSGSTTLMGGSSHRTQKTTTEQQNQTTSTATTPSSKTAPTATTPTTQQQAPTQATPTQATPTTQGAAPQQQTPTGQSSPPNGGTATPAPQSATPSP